MVQEILVAVRELTRRVPLEFMPSPDLLRAAMAAANNGDRAQAASHVRLLLNQVPDNTLTSPEFWEAFILGMRESYVKAQSGASPPKPPTDGFDGG
jgi:hypothetical protein